jgi:hypothetical protein
MSHLVLVDMLLLLLPMPAGSVGWSDNNCYIFNGNYECVAPCEYQEVDIGLDSV